MTDKAMRVHDWVEDIREVINNIHSDIGSLTKPGVYSRCKAESCSH